PPVRKSVNTPHASRIAATNDARRGPLEKRRLAAAQHTRARLETSQSRFGRYERYRCAGVRESRATGQRSSLRSEATGVSTAKNEQRSRKHKRQE
ncbi:MAG TPA: hypothetical protein VGY66_16595, partial [Gemmataceae bacterium]|nr:hypothetical protein [Gemmataceae bacterium]